MYNDPMGNFARPKQAPYISYNTWDPGIIGGPGDHDGGGGGSNGDPGQAYEQAAYANWNLQNAARDGDPDAIAQYVAQNGGTTYNLVWNETAGGRVDDPNEWAAMGGDINLYNSAIAKGWGITLYAGAYVLQPANQGGSNYSLVYWGNYENKYRTAGTLTVLKDGVGIMDIGVTSGAGNQKSYTIPGGDYNVTNYRCTTDPKFMRNGNGFKMDIGPDPYDDQAGYTRTFLEIHPARSNGTNGCIGLIGTSAEIQQFENIMSQVFTTQPSIPLYVKYWNTSPQ